MASIRYWIMRLYLYIWKFRCIIRYRIGIYNNILSIILEEVTMPPLFVPRNFYSPYYRKIVNYILGGTYYDDFRTWYSCNHDHGYGS